MPMSFCTVADFETHINPFTLTGMRSLMLSLVFKGPFKIITSSET